jgi:hypothetical protein
MLIHRHFIHRKFPFYLKAAEAASVSFATNSKRTEVPFYKKIKKRIGIRKVFNKREEENFINTKD